MGSRGQFLETGGFTEYKYHTVLRHNEVRYIMQNDGGKSIKYPEKSNSKGAVYAVIGRDKKLKGISFFNENRHKYKEIDLEAHHKGFLVHVHTCDPETSLRDNSIPIREPTDEEMKDIQSIIAYFKDDIAQKK